MLDSDKKRKEYIEKLEERMTVCAKRIEEIERKLNLLKGRYEDMLNKKRAVEGELVDGEDVDSVTGKVYRQQVFDELEGDE